MSRSVRITFEPTGRSVWVLPGTSVLEAAGQAGLMLESPCGGVGTCGKCRVRFLSAAPARGKGGPLREEELAAGWRLACQTPLETPATIYIPETSLFSEQLQILTESQQIEEISRGEPPHAVLPLPMAAEEENFAVAFDVGTTTLVGEILELPSGRERGVAAGLNPQVNFGDDVISRLGCAVASPAAAEEMRRAVVEALNALLEELCLAAGATRNLLRGISLSGNTAMQHLLLGLDVSTLARLPFAPVRTDSLEAPAEELGFPLAPGGRAWVMPVIGGFVGGDTVAGILSLRLEQVREPTLMIDLGTNGEIVLATPDGLYAASTAAGPAFEGARIACGMRAAAGAIEKIVFDGDVRAGVIGGREPIGLCGSALIDAAAELLRHGLLEPTGRLLRPDEAPSFLPEALRRRLRRGAAGEMEFLLAAGDGPRPDVVLTQRDFRELQLVVGAMRAGVWLLLRRAGLTPADLKRVFLAGGFGSFIRRGNAQRIGLIPADVPPEIVSYAGNVSLHGAKWTLLSAEARRRAETIARTARHVELSSDPDFQSAFAEAMLFPDRNP